MERDGTISTVVTSAEILEYIAEKGTAYPADLARDLNLARANVHRLLATLQGLGFVDRRSDGSCVLTFRLFELGNTVPHSRNLIDSARPAMLRLGQITGGTINHGILFEGDVMFIDKVDSGAYLKLERPIGTSQPLYCTSLGKVLLAYQEPPLQEKLIAGLSFVSWTARTITDPHRLREELARVKEEGIAYDFQELTEELNCIAAPVFGPDGSILSAISISGPASHFDSRTIPDAVSPLKATTHEVSRNLSSII
jgi:IclR family KDG regulon transcriptional repressor